MTQSPAAGWYPDPDPTYAGVPGRLRYWDGSRWTEHIHQPVPQPPAPPVPPVAPPMAPQPPAYPGVADQGAVYPGTADPATGGQPAAYPSYPSYPQAPGYPGGSQPGYYQPASDLKTTPDGQVLAGWWKRALALLLDGIIAIPLYVLAVIPVISAQWDNLDQWIDDVDAANQNGTAQPPDPAIVDPSQGAFWAFSGSLLLAYLLYNLVFLLWKQATPGKLIVGLRVRLRERPELPAGTVFMRLLGMFLLGLCWVVQIVDYLWPLWDDKRQTLHDKMAKTNVVKVR